MKRNLFALLVLAMCVIAAMLFSCSSASAQTYVQGKDGKLTKMTTVKSTAVKTPDKVFTTQDGIVFYTGAKGGVYYFKTSKKTGKQYKCYVQKSK